MAAARRQFLARGFARTRIDTIAAEARVSKQSIYEIYPDKGQLFVSTLREVIEDLLARGAAIAADGQAQRDCAPIEVVLAELFRAYSAGFLNGEGRGLIHTYIGSAQELPVLAQEFARLRRSAGELMGNGLASLVENGRLRIADLPEAAMRMASILVGDLRHMLEASPDVDNTGYADRLSTLFLHGYSVSGSPIRDAGDRTPDEPGGLAPVETPKGLRLPASRMAVLLDVAASEFLDHGFSAANLDRIAAASHVSKATIHRHFTDKTGLYRQVVWHLGCSLWSSGPPPIREGRTLEQALADLARWTLDRHLQPRNLALIALLVVEAPLLPDLARRAYETMVSVPVRELHSLLNAHNAPPADPFAAFTFFTMATFGVRFLLSSEVTDDERHTLSIRCAKLFLHGFGEAL